MDPDDLLAHVDFVRSLARSLVQDPHRAADVEQETWLAALEHPPGDKRSLRSWLARVALNFARRMYWSDKRRRRREQSFTGNGSITSPDLIAEREEIRRHLIDAVLGLENPYRKAVLLRYYDGLQPREIAERLDLPVQTVWTHLKRGLAKLRQRLDAWHGGDRRQWLLPVALLAGWKTGAKAAAASAVQGAVLSGSVIMSANTKIGLAAALMVLVACTLTLVLLNEKREESSFSGTPILEPKDLDAVKERRIIAEPSEPLKRRHEAKRAVNPVPVEETVAEKLKKETYTEILPHTEKPPFNMSLVPEGEVVMGMAPDTAYGLIQGQKNLLDILSRCTLRVTERTPADFYCDLYEVTNAQWKVYLEKTGQGPSALLREVSWKMQSTYPAGEQNLPVRNVTLEEARKFAHWCGKRIPTEVEWHRAAAGDDGRTYAWGNEWDPGRCTNSEGLLLPVGSYEKGRSPFGIYDMTGGVWEWTESPFEPFEDYEPLKITISGRELKSDPRFNSAQYVIKGGCWYLGERTNRLEVREPALPTDNLNSLGFRCVKDAEPGACMFAYALEEIPDSDFYGKALDRSGLFFMEKTSWSHSDPPSIVGYDFLLLCPRNTLPLSVGDFIETSKNHPIPIGLLSLSRPLKRPHLPPGTYAIAYQRRADRDSELENKTNTLSTNSEKGKDIERLSHSTAAGMAEQHLIYLQDFKVGGDEYIEAESVTHSANNNPVQLFHYPASRELRISMNLPMADGSWLSFQFRVGIHDFPF